MDFRKPLQKMLDTVQGLQGVSLMGIDGLPVEEVTRDESVDFQIVGAEFTLVLTNARKTFQSLGRGDLGSITLGSSDGRLVVNMITDEYYLIAALDPGANYGRTRWELTRASALLASELI